MAPDFIPLNELNTDHACGSSIADLDGKYTCVVFYFSATHVSCLLMCRSDIRLIYDDAASSNSYRSPILSTTTGYADSTLLCL